MSKRAVRLAVAALASLAAASGCIPGRDNPRDPAIAPAARLTLFDATTNVTTGDLDAPWAHAIAFDATGSTDSQDDIDHCVFVVQTTSGNPIGEPWETDCYGELHGSPFGLPGVLSLSSSYHVRVTVVDAKGNVGTAPPPGDENRRKFKITNEEPVADPGIDRVLPRAGLPWNPAQPIALTFDGSGSFDPDDEDVSYCWTLGVAGIPPEEVCSANPIASVNVDPATYPGNSLTAQLRVQDGLGAFSRTRVARVAFRSLNIWVMPQGSGSLERLDSLHRTSIYGDSNASIAATEVPASGQVVIIGDVLGDLSDGDTRDNTMHVVDPPLGPMASSPPAAGIDLTMTGLARLASDPRPSERRVWLRTSRVPSASPDFAQIDLDNCNTTDCSYLSSYIVEESGAVTAERLVDIPILFSENGDRDGGRLFVDELGRVFVANGLTAQIVVLDTNGTVTENLLGAAATPAVVVTALAPRPGTPETWIVLSHALDPVASAQPADLFIFEGAALSHTAVIADEAIPFGLGWIDRNEFWVGRPGTGMSRLNAETIANQAPTGSVLLDAAIVQVAPEITDVGSMVADRVSGDVWFSGLSGGLARVSPAGEVTSYDVGSENTQPMFVDAIGALWHTPRGTLSQAFAPSINGVAENLGVRPGNMVEYDWETGGVWFPNAVPPGMVHAADDGTILSYENRITIDGVDQFLPLTQLFRLTPGTTTGYYGGINPFAGSPLSPVYRIEDITASPMVFTEILTGLEATDIIESGSIFEPFAPIPSSPANIWTVMSGEVRLLDSDGAAAGVSFALTGPEVGFPIRAARALETNDLCFATETVTSEVRVRRITPAGTVTMHGTFTLPGSNPDLLVAVAATVDPDEGPLCWVAWKDFVPGESAHIRAFSADGRTVAAYDTDLAALPLGEQAVSILPLSTDEVWATFARLKDTSGSFDRPIWKSVLVMTSDTTLSPALTLEPTSGAQLVAPWTRGEQQGAFGN